MDTVNESVTRTNKTHNNKVENFQEYSPEEMWFWLGIQIINTQRVTGVPNINMNILLFKPLLIT